MNILMLLIGFVLGMLACFEWCKIGFRKADEMMREATGKLETANKMMDSIIDHNIDKMEG